MKKKTVIIATRESPLALWQANWVKAALQTMHPHLEVILSGITTSGDKQLSEPLYKTGGKGLFVKELEEALYDKRADLAVHSMKDVPMQLPDGLCIAVMCAREDPRDALVSNDFLSLAALPIGATVGTSSLRRQGQLLARHPHLKPVFLRGNVNTRLEKLDRGEYAAIILAVSGLKRLGWEDRIRALIPTNEMLPAAGQGVLGIECRAEDAEIQALIAPLNDPVTRQCVLAERALCRMLGGGCHVPVGALAEWMGDSLVLRGLVTNLAGTTLLHASGAAAFDEAEALGERVARSLLTQGARALLDDMHD